MLPFSKTQIAKYAVKLIVASNVAKLSTRIIADNTNVDPDGIPVKIGAAVVGHVAAEKAEPYTDRFVEMTIARYQDWKASKNATN